MYKVLKPFSDLLDDCYVYEEGAMYPRDGYTPTDERIEELAGTENARGEALIEAPKATKKVRAKKAPE